MSKSNNVIVVIPARYNSTRLPGKPLLDIAGKPMVQHVYEKALLAEGVDDVVVATDDQRIVDAVNKFNGKVVMTSSSHISGTDRIVEVMKTFPSDIYINLQGDEPLVRHQDISKLAALMKKNHIPVGTLYHIIDANEALNPNTVKVVLDNNGQALYFSRSAVPYSRKNEGVKYYKHIGVYAYTSEVLNIYTNLQPSMLETAESLEQLRLLSSGIRIHGIEVDKTGPGVDTPECLEKVRAIFSGTTESTLQNPLENIKLVITDVDGVLTDGAIIYNEQGECLKQFHVRDGLGIRMLIESGIQVAVLSGRDSKTLRKRIEDLGISSFLLGVKDKAKACDKLMQNAGVLKHQTACTGDDTIDLPAFNACGYSFAVADAPSYIKSQASHILKNKGGKGAFREVSDLILTAQKKSDIFNSAAGFETIMSGSAQ